MSEDYDEGYYDGENSAWAEIYDIFEWYSKFSVDSPSDLIDYIKRSEILLD